MSLSSNIVLFSIPVDNVVVTMLCCMSYAEFAYMELNGVHLRWTTQILLIFYSHFDGYLFEVWQWILLFLWLFWWVAVYLRFWEKFNMESWFLLSFELIDLYLRGLCPFVKMVLWIIVGWEGESSKWDLLWDWYQFPLWNHMLGFYL